MLSLIKLSDYATADEEEDDDEYEDGEWDDAEHQEHLEEHWCGAR